MLDAFLPFNIDETAATKDGNGPSLGIGSAMLESYFLAALYRSLGATLVEDSQVRL